MKFKVGDRVKLVKLEDEKTYYKKYLNKIFTIREILCGMACLEEKTEEGITPYLKNLELVKDEYTYEDLKKCPVGTKVTMEDGEVFIKDDIDYFENAISGFANEYIKRDFKIIDSGKIIKIEEPKYTTVYEVKPEILDEAEKRYLRGVIRPFRDKVDYIVKQKSGAINKEYILIHFPNNLNIRFPYFKPNTLYKEMALDKAYTLEELGL